jgi:starch synthase
MVAAEAHPHVRGGGLSHVVGGLARGLAARGHRVDLLVPHIPSLSDASGATDLGTLHLPVGARTLEARLLSSQADGVRVLWLSAPELFDRPGIYGTDGADFADNVTRFVALSRAALACGAGLKQRHDVLHAHDWPTALACYHAREMRLAGAHNLPRATLLTVHNLGFQGLFWALDLPLLGLGPEHYSPERLEYFDQLSLLKAGLVSADRVVTVSPSYAREALSPEGGRGMDGVLRARGPAFSGVLHGVDVDAWNPATDRSIPNRYADPTTPERRRNAQAFRARAGLPDVAAPVFSFVGDLSRDAGADTLLASVPDILQHGQLVVATHGRQAESPAWKALAQQHASLSLLEDLPEADLRLLLAGTDYLLCPSRVEPFNFMQMCAMRYGAIPVVRRTGALRDTVVDAVEPAQGGNGIAFVGEGTPPLVHAVRRAAALHQDAPRFQAVQKRAAALDVSNNAALDRYEQLYADISHQSAVPPRP